MKRASRLEPLARAVLRTQSDDRLVSLAREGREQAFEEIVRRYRPGLVAFAAAYGARDSAEDVVQESLERSWDALRNSESEIQLKPWLYAIVRNRALNARRDTRAHDLLDEGIDGARRPDEIVLDREEFDRMVVAIKALPEAQRRALLESAFAGYTHEQIATSLGSNSNAVGQLIWRARAAVRHGVGLVIPMPLLRALPDSGPEEAVAGVGVGGGAVIATTGGTSLVAKGATVALIGVVAAGSGVAIEQANEPDPQPSRAAAIPAERARHAGGGQAPGSTRPGSVEARAASGDRADPDDERHGGAGRDGSGGDGGRGSSSSGSGSGGGGSAGGPGSSASGSGNPGSAADSGSSSSGSSGSSGSGSDGRSHGSDHDDEGGEDLDDKSGSGDEDAFEETEIEPEDDSSDDSDELEAPESESSEHSGSGGSGGSDSGPGDD